MSDMPQLVTLEGIRFYFNVTAVTAVADSDADTGDKVTTVYGLAAERLRISASPEHFLQSVQAADTFVELTRLDNSHVWISAPAVGAIHSPVGEDDDVGANCVIPLGGIRFAVKEALDEVRRLLNAHGSNL
jgi:hypothetical protein